MSRRRLKPYLKVFEDLDIQILEIGSTGSCHHKVIAESNGHKRFFIVPFSSSDRRGLLNFKSDVRKWVQSLEK
jgi:hypothetical protein